MKRKCLQCGVPIRGRSDKKFCSAQCRNYYNNRRNRDVNNFIRNVNNTLRKNRRIMRKLTPAGKATVHKKQLQRAGFDFDYYTYTYKTNKGKLYFFCYEYGYLPLENDYYLLVKRNISGSKKQSPSKSRKA